MPNRRVLMVALDGLDISSLQRGMESGRLPNLKAFTEGSRELRVSSDGERLEGTVWPTFTSGMSPGEHGHHWFFQWIAEDSKFVDATDPRLATTPFWNEAVEQGRRVTVFDLPYALPIGHQNERVFTGWGLQDEMDQHAHPASFKREIRRRHGRSKVEKDTLLVRTPEDRLRLARKLRAGVRQRSRLLLDLVERRDWDVFILGFGEYHLGGHHLSMPMQLSPKVDNVAALMGILQPLDEAWPAIVRAAGDDCDILLFAIHGMRPMVSYPEAVRHIVDGMHGKPPAPPAKEDLLRKVRNLVPEQIHRAIWLRLPASIRLDRMIQMARARMDTAHDRMFVFEGDCAVAIRLNVQGREKFGVVAPDGARAALDGLWRELQRYRSHDGHLPFADMIVTADVYRGPRVDRLPDAMLIYNPSVQHVRELTRDDGHLVEILSPESRNGIHTGQGFCFYRPAGEVNIRTDTIDNVDFAPTVLERVGVTPDVRLEGTPFV